MNAVTIIKTNERAKVIHRENGETIVEIKGQTRLFKDNELSKPESACPICLKALTCNGRCPDADTHTLKALLAAANSSYLNRAAKRKFRAAAQRLARKLQKLKIEGLHK
jgi:hypothetical protein